MKEYILKDIETVKANLEILTKKTKVNKAKYNEYLEEQLKKITPMIEEAEKEISKRVEQIKKHNTEESLPEERELLDIAKVKRLSSLSSSSNKVSLNSVAKLCSILYINLSQLAKIAGKINNINIIEQNVPCDIVLHILLVIAEAREPTINVTIINIDDEVKIV